MPVTTLTIDGMRTVHCVRAVRTALALVGGARAAHVELGRAEVEHDGVLDAEGARAALELVGYSLRAAVLERRSSLTILPEH